MSNFELHLAHIERGVFNTGCQDCAAEIRRILEAGSKGGPIELTIVFTSAETSGE